MIRFHFITYFISIIFFSVIGLLFAKHSYAAYSPSQIREAYNLPSTGGSGIVAIILWESSPTLESDNQIFNQKFGLPECSLKNGCLSIHYMDGHPHPPSESGAIIETNMDVQWVHAIAPDSKILLVAASSASNGDVADAISFASSQPNVVAVSMSLGVPHSDGQIPCTMFSNPSIAYFAASGDNGTEVDWPAYCPEVIAVGGTTLSVNGAGVNEVAWSGSGGGLSRFVPAPSYQTAFSIPNSNGFRGVPDVSGIADPRYGATVIVQGKPVSAGGTSLAAPIWAGISALNGTPITHESLYANAAASTYSKYYRDITQGKNGNCGTYCNVVMGYDYVTGLGSPIALPGSSGLTGGLNPTTGVVPTPTGSISKVIDNIVGVVFDDLNNNSHQESGEKGIPAANLTLIGGAGGGTQSDANGGYSFTKLSPGDYNIKLTYLGQSITSGKVSLSSSLSSPPEIDFAVHLDNSTNNPIIVPVTPVVTVAPTPTTTPDNGGGSGGFQKTGTPTPTPDQYFSCTPDPNCAKSNKSIQLCPLICKPQ